MSTEDYFKVLKKAYPDKAFYIMGGVIFLEVDSTYIFDPLVSDCGRFPSTDYYGLKPEDAVELSKHNAFYWKKLE